MRAHLLADGSLTVRTASGTRIIRPHHPRYAALMKLYAERRDSRAPVALSAATPTDYGELATAIANQWNRQQESGEPVTTQQLEHAATTLAPGAFQITRSIGTGDEWHAWPMYEIQDDGSPVPAGVMVDGQWVRPGAVSLSAAAVEEAAAATAEPSLAQRRSGNYRKGRCEVHGLPIVIEVPRGRIRAGIDHNGKPWLTTMPWHYGYFAPPGARSEADAQHVDLFIGPDPDSGLAFVIDQLDPRTGAFDELKVMLGFRTEAEARQGYLDSYEPGWRGLGSIRAVPVGALRLWLVDHAARGPISEETIRLSASGMVARAAGPGVSAEVRAQAERAVRRRIGDDADDIGSDFPPAY